MTQGCSWVLPQVPGDMCLVYIKEREKETARNNESDVTQKRRSQEMIGEEYFEENVLK
jgi:hypothetical protein